MKIDDAFPEKRKKYQESGYDDYERFISRIEKLKTLGYEDTLCDFTEECGIILGYMTHKASGDIIPLAITQFDKDLAGPCKAISTGVILGFLGLIANGYKDILDDKSKLITYINETVDRIPAMCATELLGLNEEELSDYGESYDLYDLNN